MASAPGGGIAGDQALVAAGDESGIDLAGGEIGVLRERDEKGEIGGCAGDLGSPQRARQRRERGIALGRVHDQLGNRGS